MFTLIAKGGPIMYLLFLCSFIGLYIVVQKLLFLRINRIKNAAMIDRIKQRLEQEGRERTATFLLSDRRLMTKIFSSVIQHSDLPAEELQPTIEHITRRDLGRLEQNMGTLSSIITVAPILGLMGTVLGLMDIFQVISGGGLGDPAQLSGGIAKALITTVTGLGIAIPLIFLHGLITRLNDEFVMQTEEYTNDILHFCRQKGGTLL